MSKSLNQKKEPLNLNRLAVVMKEEKWSNRILAEKMGYDETTVSLWANNHIQPPTQTMTRIALLMERNLQEFYVDTTRFDKTKKERYLKELAEIAKRSKRVGKDKVKKSSPIRRKK